MYKIFNKTYQPILLIGGVRIPQRSYVFVEILTKQIKNLEARNFLISRKI